MTGISHITVLSGYNVALVVLLLGVLLKFVPFYVRMVLTISGVLFFVSVTDGGASLVRASLMAVIALVSLTIGKGYHASRALVLTLYILSVYDPYGVLYDVSLHLSFLATIGIIYGAPPLMLLYEKFLPRFLVEASAITTACTLITLPYTIAMFGSVSIYSLIVNLLVTELVPLFTVGVLLVVFLSFISSSLASLLGVIVFLLGDGISLIASFGSSLPYALITFSMSMVGASICYTIIILVYVSTTLHTVTQKNETLDTRTNETWSPVMKF